MLTETIEVQGVRSRFGQAIYTFLQLDHNEDLADNNEGAQIVDAFASPKSRLFILDVIAECKTQEVKEGASAAYCWIFKASSCLDARKALDKERARS